MTRDAFARFRGGDTGAVHEAVEAYAPPAYLAAFGIIGDASAAEAIAVETLLEGLRTPAAEVWGGAGEPAWVAADARARAIAAVQEAPGPGPLPSPPQADAEAARACFEALPAGSRHLLALAATSAASMEQVAHRSGLGLASARDAVREALLQLQASSDGAGA
jgi:DNA-directed RNA polymerase specialized sigma24 family protein